MTKEVPRIGSAAVTLTDRREENLPVIDRLRTELAEFVKKGEQEYERLGADLPKARAALAALGPARPANHVAAAKPAARKERGGVAGTAAAARTPPIDLLSVLSDTESSRARDVAQWLGEDQKAIANKLSYHAKKGVYITKVGRGGYVRTSAGNEALNGQHQHERSRAGEKPGRKRAGRASPAGGSGAKSRARKPAGTGTAGRGRRRAASAPARGSRATVGAPS
jgi:hypothetical protein